MGHLKINLFIFCHVYMLGTPQINHWIFNKSKMIGATSGAETAGQVQPVEQKLLNKCKHWSRNCSTSASIGAETAQQVQALEQKLLNKCKHWSRNCLTDATSGAETDYPSIVSEFAPSSY